MKIISHRGNLDGPNLELENSPMYIDKALSIHYDVEIDVWLIDNIWYLGHDKPTYIINFDYLSNYKFWLHAKNGDAFYELLQDEKHHVFWHTTEDWVLTSKKYIWTYPNKYLYPDSVCVLPELSTYDSINHCYAICTDFCNAYNVQNNKRY